VTPEPYRTRPRETTLAEFLDNAAAAQPTPGGGGVAALSGALASSMVEMALNFTAGRKKFAAVDARARSIAQEMALCRNRLLDLVAADGEAYQAVAAATRMPKETDAEKLARRKALDLALAGALEPPLEMTRVMSRVAAALPEVAAIANPNLAGDVAVAAQLLPAAARAAALNVWANIHVLGGDAAARTEAEVDGIIAGIEQASSRAYKEVECRIRPGKSQGAT
jgi:formiminotetrahydrofolate cyclodeaminase